MAGCTPSMAAATEYEFVTSLAGRAPGQCHGPAVTLFLSGYRLELLEEALHSRQALDRLWDGFEPYEIAWDGRDDKLAFRLCAAHWFDLSRRAGQVALISARRDLFGVAGVLLHEVLTGAGWDPKEVANMVTWQRVQLT